MAGSDTPVADTITEMTAASLENSDLSPREFMLARLAALVAVNAPPASYVFNVGAAVDSGVTLEDVQGVLVAVVPIVGTARVVSSSINIAQGLGIAVGLAEAAAEGNDA